MFAPEGIIYIVSAIGVVILTTLFAFITRRKSVYAVLVFCLLLAGMMFYFFRDPVRPLPSSDKIVAPTDGRIIQLSSDQSDSVHITIYLNLFDVHQVRAPVTGRVTLVEHVPGTFYPAYHDSASHNEHMKINIETSDGIVYLKVLSGVLTRRILCHVQEGDSVLAGQRIGFIRFGSRSEIAFPANFDPDLDIGDRVCGGTTMLGEWRNPSNQ